MSRAERLLQLLQVLGRYRRPVSGQILADELGVSIRTLYRDIASLQAQGAMIEGEPGVGYVMKPGFMLPPIMFRPEELDALVLGMRWVADRGDKALSAGASSTLAKIAAVLPAELRRELQESSLLVGAPLTRPAHTISPDLLRAAVRAEQKIEITYVDSNGIQSRRVVWPFALVYFDQARVLMCWCELRTGFRNFLFPAKGAENEVCIGSTGYPRYRTTGRVLSEAFRDRSSTAGRWVCRNAIRELDTRDFI